MIMIMCVCGVNRLRRHERPVLGEAVSIVHLDDELVVVHKPPSVPVSFAFSFFKRLSQITSEGGEWMTTKQSSLSNPLKFLYFLSKLFAPSRRYIDDVLLRILHSHRSNLTVERSGCNYFSDSLILPQF